MPTLKKQLNRFRIMLIILAVIVIGLLAIIAGNRNKATTLPTQSIEKVQTRTVKQTVSVDGNLAGTDDRSVYLPTLSKVTEIDVSVGQHANADALLGKADEPSGVSTKNVNFNAPISGVIAEINYKVGDTVTNATLPLFRIIDTSSYVISLNVNENDIPNLSLDQPAEISIPAISLDQMFSGKVTFIAPIPNSTSGAVTYLVKIAPDNLPATIKPGMSASVVITTARVDNVLAVPESYLIEQDGKQYVKQILWDDETHTTYQLSQVEVTIGLKTDEYVEIRSGLKAGDEILEPSYVVQRKSLFGV